jgi:hypothetical protein
MKKIIALAVLLTAPAVPASAQMTQYYGSDGSYQGQSMQMGNTRQYYGPGGTYEGQSVDTGMSTQYYSGTGAYQGQSMHTGGFGYR